MNKHSFIARALSLGISVLIFAPTLLNAQVVIEEGLDAWQTDPCEGIIDLPALPPGFFGPGSDPLPPMDDFKLKGHPFPDIFGVPNPFPRSQTEVVLQWFDPHGTPVGPDSQHGVTSTPRVVIPDPPYNFDTVVERKGDILLDAPGDDATVDIEMVWLSLVSCEPITVTSNGGNPEEWDIYVGLSETVPPITGRMKLEAEIIRPGGGGSGPIELGDTDDPVNDAFENGNFDFFVEDPDALGLPVAYQLLFIKRNDPNAVIPFDDPTGQSGIKTLALFTNDGNPDGEWRKREKDCVLAHPGLDSWSTTCDSFVQVPVEFGPGFFGPGSLPVLNPFVRLEGWPFDFPYGPPPRFPDDQLTEMHVWLDQHGSVVGSDSAHKVTETTIVVTPQEPYNFDTVVERLHSALFCEPGDTAEVEIEMVWLSLRSCEPIVVDYENGSQKQWWVHVGLSERIPSPPGRMRVTADTVDEAGGLLHMDLGQVGDPVDQNYLEDLKLPFGALGLPVHYKIGFVEDGTQEVVQELDDPTGQLFSGGQLPTLALFHNELGGTMKILQAVPGDANLDGRCDVFDIDDFITALIDQVLYRELRGADPNLVCDLNGDGSANAFDIQPFVDLLTGRKTLAQILEEIQRGCLDQIFPVLGVGPDGWQVTGSAPFGFTQVQDIAQGLADLESPNVAAGNFDAVNFADPESDPFGAGNFLGDIPFPNNTQLNDDDFAMLAEATLVVPEDSDYDIGFLGDDGGFLTIEGQVFDDFIINETGQSVGLGTDTITCDCQTGNSHTVARIFLEAGEYPIRAFLFERSGGAHIEVFGGPSGGPKRLLLRNGAGFESLFDGLLPEIAGGSAPLIANPDLDGDGVSNLDELRAGTDPLDASSFLRLESISVSNQGVQFSWPSLPQLEYDIEFLESARPGTWEVVNEKPIVATGSITSWIGVRPDSPTGFYRVSVRPLPPQ